MIYLYSSDTSRPPRVLEENGKNYWFMDRENMEREISANNFLEYGEYNGNLYGTHLDSIRDIIKQGKKSDDPIWQFWWNRQYRRDKTTKLLPLFQAKCAFWTVHRVHWKCFTTAPSSCHMSSSLLHPEWSSWNNSMLSAESPAVHNAIWRWVCVQKWISSLLARFDLDQYTKRFRCHFLVRPAKFNPIQFTASTDTWIIGFLIRGNYHTKFSLSKNGFYAINSNVMRFDRTTIWSQRWRRVRCCSENTKSIWTWWLWTRISISHSERWLRHWKL